MITHLQLHSLPKAPSFDYIIILYILLCKYNKYLIVNNYFEHRATFYFLFALAFQYFRARQPKTAISASNSGQ